MGKRRVPFNRPYAVGTELDYIVQAISSSHLSGNGSFTKRCHKLLEEQTGTHKALLTHSCTAALEMAAILADLGPGDEVIMPSFTFVSTANAFVLRGAVPVFIDIRKDTLCIDETLIEAAITQRTKAICVVHYAGVAAEMDEINAIAKRHGIPVIEDAAQGSMSTYKGRALGSLGTFGALSYHETKNLISGEGGALLVNDARYASRAEIIWEKGTNRSSFFRGEVDKYTWVDVGSSFLPSELTAAFLWGQFERGAEITERRLHLWDLYAQALAPLEKDQLLRCPTIPAHCKHNAHMFYILLRTHEEQNAVIESLKEAGIESVFHYVPLHSSPAGRKFGRTGSPMDVTDSISQRLVRLPIWVGMSETAVSESAAIIRETLVDRSK